MKRPLIHAASALAAALALALTGPATWAAHGDAHDTAHDHSHDAHAHSHDHGTPHKGTRHTDLADLPLSEHVTADECWIRQLPKPTPSGGFLILHNAGSETATVEAVASPDYEDVMLHQTTEENGVSKMSMIHALPIPAGEQVALKPGSYHLMLEGPKDGIAIGDDVRIRFALADGTAVNADCRVMPPTATGKS